ncbi:MAG: TIGR04086 family membrane protein [Ruminococcaceae bacterium]|nr:TIGR04086 family membrane protein [Oscillospiraceae bacterium]
MMKKATGTAPSLLRAVACGITASCVGAILWAAVLAKLLDGEVIKMETVGYWTMAAHVTAVLAGGLFAAGRAGHRRALVMGITGAGYYICLLLVNALFFGGQFTGMGVTLLLVAAAVGAGTLTAGKGSAGTRHRRYKIPR